MIYICSFTAMDVFLAVFTYFVIYGLKQDASLASLLLSNMMFMSIPGTFVFMMLLGRLNMTPSTALRISYLSILVILFFLFAVYLWHWQVPALLFSAIFLFMGIARAGLFYIPWNIYSFIPDIDEMVTCKRREGIFAGVMVLTRKSSVAIAIFMIGVVLQESGFTKGNGAQPESAINAIVVLMVFVSGTLLTISFWLTYKFKLTQSSHRLLIKEVARRKLGGAPKDCDAETRKVIKSLTGYEYDEVWGVTPAKKTNDTAVNSPL